MVKSTVYSATPAEVVSIPAAKLTLSLVNNPDTKDVDETKVDIAKIAEAVLAYGPKAGEVYALFNVAAYDYTETEKYITNWHMNHLYILTE